MSKGKKNNKRPYSANKAPAKRKTAAHSRTKSSNRRSRTKSRNSRSSVQELPWRQPQSKFRHTHTKTKYRNTEYRPPFSLAEFLRLHRGTVILLLIIIIVLSISFLGISYVRSHYRIKNVQVSGNSWYTSAQIEDMVMSGMFSHNSLYLSMKYRNRDIENIPFIEKITVDILDADSIRINVYEKSLAGCIEYLEKYMYFDREGIVVEGSSKLLHGVPVVTGLKFDRVVLYEPLTVENKDVFAEILDLTQILAKYSLQADKIYFDRNYNVYLYFGTVEVAIGSEENIDEKVIQLPYILPNLEGKTGTLHMEEYNENTESIRFEEG